MKIVMNMVMDYVIIVNTNNEFLNFSFFVSIQYAFDSALLDIEPLFESYDDLTMSNTLTDNYTNSYLLSQSRRLSNSTSGKQK